MTRNRYNTDWTDSRQALAELGGEEAPSRPSPVA